MGIIANVAPADSAWSRGPGGSECRIGDLTHAEAMEYMIEKRQLDEDTATKILDFFGSRILLLKAACGEVKTGTDLDSVFPCRLLPCALCSLVTDYIVRRKSAVLDDFFDDARAIDEDRAIKIARRIIRNGPLDKWVYTRMCGAGDIYKRFLATNVFAVNADGLYDFENKAVENAVREGLGEAKGWSWSWLL